MNQEASHGTPAAGARTPCVSVASGDVTPCRWILRDITRALVAFAALLVATCASLARAAPLPVVIEKLSATATACGISELQLESLARRTLENSRVQSDAGAGGWLRVRVKVTSTRRNSCTARISAGMKAFAKASHKAANPSQRPSLPVIVLCDKTSEYSAPKAAFPSAIGSVVEYSIKQCLGSLQY
jgi:hypothetical protein